MLYIIVHFNNYSTNFINSVESCNFLSVGESHWMVGCTCGVLEPSPNVLAALLFLLGAIFSYCAPIGII